ncbi:gas vesicle protein [Actinomadura scrupuli]|uniref:gas vesicle protein n=1 Tax=Actinomadura scrupuli TaxID=559629 RepID=UPI003D965C80
MTDPMAGRGMTGYGRSPAPARRTEPANLADILERVLDKGIVIAGDIQVNLLDIELLTIKLRLVIASVDRAKEMGIDWWEHDPTLSSSGRSEMAAENRRLRERIEALEAATAAADEGAQEISPAAGRRAPKPVDRREAAEPDLDAAGPDHGRRDSGRRDYDSGRRERTGRSRLDDSEEDGRG